MHELKSQGHCVIDIYIFPLMFFLTRAKIQGARNNRELNTEATVEFHSLWRFGVQKYVGRKLTVCK